MKILKNGILGWLVVLLLLLPAFLHGQPEGEERAISFEVRGTVAWRAGEGFDLTEFGLPQDATFRLGCRGNNRFMEITPSQWPVRIRFGHPVKNPVKYLFQSNEKQSFVIQYYQNTNTTNITAATWEGNMPLRRLHLRHAYTLWHAFLSHPFGARLDPRLFETSMSADNNRVKGHYQTNKWPPYLPERFEIFAQEGRRMETYQARSWTNLNGLALPLSGRHSYYSTIIANTEKEWFYVEFAVTQVSLACEFDEGALDFGTNSFAMRDYTYAFADPPFSSYQYSNVPIKLEDTKEAYANYKTLRQWKHEPRKPKGGYLVYGLVGILLLLPLICFAVLRKRK